MLKNFNFEDATLKLLTEGPQVVTWHEVITQLNHNRKGKEQDKLNFFVPKRPSEVVSF